ncbi:MAG: DUF3857 domain-containing protein [Crocinitomicaceae bacterium]|nr:DUF3857 domain-containing protein [Crocinitomicaceae bacterium]
MDETDFRTIDSEPSSWVFHDDDKEVVFDLLEIREGYRSVIEYTKKLKKPEFFDRFHFVNGFPTEYSMVKITYPASTVITFYERAFKNYKVEKNETIDKKGNKVVSWELRDIAPFRRESGSTNINNHIPHILAQIVSYEANGTKKELIGSVEQLHKFYEEFLLQKETETNRKELNDVVRSLIENKTTEIEKMDTIYKWVQENIKYIAFEDGINGYVPRSCSVVMKNRYGDCKDMGNLLVEMLTFAGVPNAYVAWVGTDNIPYQMSEIPSPLTCNHVIAVVEKEDGTFYYLDATGSEMGYLLPPDVIQEKEILIHKGPGKFQLYKVPAEAKHNYFKMRIDFTYDAVTDSIRGTGKDYFGGYERQSRSYELKNSDPEDLFDYVKEITLSNKNRYTLHDFELANVDNNNAELQIDYTFASDNTIIEHEGDYIINPVLFRPRLTQFNSADYHYDRSKAHHRSVDYEYRFTIPAGFKLKTLPENISFKHDLFHFDAKYSVEGNVVTTSLTYEYHLLVIPTSLFNDWNAFSDSVNKASAQNIVFQKI